MIDLPHCSSSLEHPSLMTQAPVPTQFAPQQPVSTTQPVRMAPVWQGKFALFQNNKPGSKSAWSGRVSIPADALAMVIQTLQTTTPNERGDIELWLTGFNNTSRSGLQYIGGFVAPQTNEQGPAVQYANQQLAAPGMVQQAYAGQQQAMNNAQQQVYRQPVPAPQPQPAPQTHPPHNPNHWVTNPDGSLTPAQPPF